MRRSAALLPALTLLSLPLAAQAQNTGVGIGTTAPQARLHVVDSTVLFSATGDVPATPSLPALGSGRRMLWHPGKAAFRAGYLDGTGATYWDNANTGLYSFATGYNPRAGGTYAFAAGFSTTASGLAAVALGYNGIASGERSLAFSGTASGARAIALGDYAQATGDDAVALGSSANATGLGALAFLGATASAQFSIAMGVQSRAARLYSVAIGNNARVYYQGSWVFSDASSGTLNDSAFSTATNQMTMRFAGGYRLFSSQQLVGATATGVTLAAGGGSWASVSDRRKKENVRTVDAEGLLQKLAALPVTEWNYKAQPATQRHIGPMAQDFYAAFKLDGIGADTTINTIDIDGVNMAAIQALEARTAALKAENEALRARVAALEAGQASINTALLNRLEALEQEKTTTPPASGTAATASAH